MHVSLVTVSLDPWAEPGDRGWRGRARHPRGVAEALRSVGHHVDVVTAGPGDGTDATTVPSRHVRTAAATDAPANVVDALSAHLAAAWADRRPDVVYAHHWTAVLAARRAAGAVGPPVVATVFASGFEQDPDRRQVERAVLADCGGVVVSSSADRDAVVGGGVPPERLTVVPATVDHELFHPAGPALCRGERPRLVSAGGVDAGSGADAAIRALAGLPRAELLVAGGMPPGADDPDRDRLFALARRYGVAGRVRFLGPVPRTAVPRLLRSADVALCTPPDWTAGSAALEAMACGRAVVVTAVGAHRDLVVDGVSGLVVPPRDGAALVRALRDALGHGSRRAGFGVAGRNRVEAVYRRDRVLRTLTGAFERAGCAGVVAA